tara:strand:+ start:225 stop:593 length:369 start_codon:yes stop_codon:yes gene_type:complete
VGGDRAETHGSMSENHENIAMLWNGYLHNKDTLTAEDAANMMELLKIARRKLGTFNEDDYVDGAGYAAVALECAEEQEEKKRQSLARIESREELVKELTPGLNELFGSLDREDYYRAPMDEK